MTSSSDDSRAGLTPAGLGGGPVELAPGRQTAEGRPRPPAVRGPVPGRAGPGTAAPLPHPTSGSGAAQAPVSGALNVTDAPEAGSRGLSGQAFRDAVRKALSGNAKAQRNNRGKRRADPAPQAGMIRRRPR